MIARKLEDFYIVYHTMEIRVSIRWSWNYLDTEGFRLAKCCMHSLCKCCIAFHRHSMFCCKCTVH